jgi:hypothetical protein
VEIAACKPTGRDVLHEIQFIRDLACVMLAAGVVVVIFPRLR